MALGTFTVVLTTATVRVAGALAVLGAIGCALPWLIPLMLLERRQRVLSRRR